MTLDAAIRMGGYGAYVWTSYGITLLGLGSLVIAVRRRWRSAIKEARRRLNSKEQVDASAHSGEETASDEMTSPR